MSIWITMSPTPQLSNLNALKPYIDSEGLVNYKSLKEDKWLSEQVKQLETANLQDMNNDEEFAFWLNAYNILTLKGVCVELKSNPKWKGNLSLIARVKFFVLRRFQVAGKKINLRDLENKILRERFKDPRIHFAINCASKSCPNLPDRLFKAESLDSYLDSLTTSFINDADHVFLDTEAVILYLNPIFKWYKKDFKISGGVKDFILKYLKNPSQSFINTFKKAKIIHLKYDWAINSQHIPRSLLKIDVID